MFGANLTIYVSVVNDLDNGNWLLLPQEAVTGLEKVKQVITFSNLIFLKEKLHFFLHKLAH